MKNIDIKGYLEAAKASEKAWEEANNKLIEIENKIKALNVDKAQLKLLLDNVSMGSTHLKLLIENLEAYYLCMCGEFEAHKVHSSDPPFSIDAHAYTNAYEFKRNEQ